MADEAETTIRAMQKNDDGKWYYTITIDDEEGPKVGPFETEEAALAAGEEDLAEDNQA
ncbi:hypothetical protein M8997_001385 [Phyllobacterium sp. 21LDTY02-6]|jgi:hypothetical protein|uniref:hypothetical protein n=1 Tax=unclassified Phyllobacterium TaxID=2638441 RepID=UPI0020229898|nr:MULTISPECIES: hypothetical protein [unclassified Phyllobacterium]MCO4315821.1 hypothetical protein [Phyllobacterium sp. 21LDTY02-6]MCX8282320.1 hypothetical protein [Phyllobacterium sp. 0TCS1.6C]MCX8292054.1 hypothetical protein [Phyllobacterium sp. 0TCS1.6A]